MSSSMVRLGDIADKITKGTTPTTYGKNFVDCGINFIKVEAITEDGSFKRDKIVFIDKDTHENLLKRSQIQKGDILLTMAGAIGRIALVDDDWLVPANTNQAVCIIRVTNKNWNTYFLKYFLKSPLAITQITGGTVQTAQPNISLSQISSIHIPEVDIVKQNKIAKILGDLDRKIELNRKMNVTLEQMGQTLFKHYFVDNPENKDWQEVTIGEYFDIVLGGTPSRNKPEYWGGRDIGWINSGTVNQFRITKPSEYITNEGLEKSATKVLPSGTTVLAITGATLGQVSRLEKEFAANQSVVGIYSNDTNLNNFFYYWITINISDITRHGTGGAQQHVNKGDVENTRFKLPPQNLLKEHGGELKELLSKISGNVKQIDILVELRDSLLPRLIDGRVIV